MAEFSGEHYIGGSTSSGWECTCGRTFYGATKFGQDALKTANLMLGNAKRHAAAANGETEQGRFYAGKHEDGSWQVFDRDNAAKSRFASNAWEAKRIAAHLNGKHLRRNYNCYLCD